MLRGISLCLISLFLLENINAQQFATLTDSRDGKVYKTVKIGEQIWMAENLHAFYFRNGDPIPIAKTTTEWMQAFQNKQPACSYYTNKYENGKTYGLLYNFYALIDKRGIAPEGWYIPNLIEVMKLMNYLGGYTQAKKILKSEKGWNSYQGKVICEACKSWTIEQIAGSSCNQCKDTRYLIGDISGNGANKTGFSALPGGYRWDSYFGLGPYFEKEGELALWWLYPSNFLKLGWGIDNELGQEFDSIYQFRYVYESPISNALPIGLSLRCLQNIENDELQNKFDSTIISVNNESPLYKTINYSSINDSRDGKVYKTVKIRNQEWMAENLNVDRFRNGDLIPHVKSYKDWDLALKNRQPAWCYYENNPANGLKYGRLYNWYAVNDPRGLAPKGWHIPSDEDWDNLTEYFGIKGLSSTKLKSKSGWMNNTNGTNSSGFNGLPGGRRDQNIEGAFSGDKYLGQWWSSTEDDSKLHYRIIYSESMNDPISESFPFHKRDKDFKEFNHRERLTVGLSVRCVKDK